MLLFVFPKQPAHDAFLVCKRLTAGMLVAEAALGEVFCRTDIQYNQFADFVLRQALRGNAW